MSRDLKIDLLFNYASLAVLAVAGLLMNWIVVRLMGEAALGVFNQAYAIYVACSQLAVGGVHISVLRSVAQADSGAERAAVGASGLALSLGLGCAVCVVVVATRNVWGTLLGSPEVARSLWFVGPALVLFALNKTLLAIINGLRAMRVFAVLQALRYVAIILVLLALAWQGRPAAELSAAFVLSELLVAVAAAPYVLGRLGLGLAHVQRGWLERHLSFGARGLFSGVFLELNTRVDVLAIGYFLSDQDVGRYSLAAVLAEGLYQCLVVVRNQVNPVLAQRLLTQDSTAIVDMVRRAWRYLYPGMALVYLAGLGVFHVILTYVLPTSQPGEALACYAILGAGVLAVSGFAPFDGVLLHSGRPAHYTLVTFLVVLTNALLNLLFIPVWGIRGAALATACAFGLSILYLSLVMRWQLGFSYLGLKSSPERARHV